MAHILLCSKIELIHKHALERFFKHFFSFHLEINPIQYKFPCAPHTFGTPTCTLERIMQGRRNNSYNNTSYTKSNYNIL